MVDLPKHAGRLSRVGNPRSDAFDYRPQPAAPTIRSPEHDAFVLFWSRRRLRRYAMVLVGLMPFGGLAIISSVAALKVLGLIYLSWLTWLAHGVQRRAADRQPVVTIDRIGIRDRRLMQQTIVWTDVAMLEASNVARTQVLELHLLHPRAYWRATRAQTTPWHVRFGARLQAGFSVPAITISLLLLDTRAADVYRAIAFHRPGFLPKSIVAELRG